VIRYKVALEKAKGDSDLVKRKSHTDNGHVFLCAFMQLPYVRDVLWPAICPFDCFHVLPDGLGRRVFVRLLKTKEESARAPNMARRLQLVDADTGEKKMDTVGATLKPSERVICQERVRLMGVSLSRSFDNRHVLTRSLTTADLLLFMQNYVSYAMAPDLLDEPYQNSLRIFQHFLNITCANDPVTEKLVLQARQYGCLTSLAVEALYPGTLVTISMLCAFVMRVMIAPHIVVLFCPALFSSRCWFLPSCCAAYCRGL
jgi:hypothetical protein